MKNNNLIILSSIIIFSISCKPTEYLITSTGESFEQLTKITDIGKPCFGANGGDFNKNLYFSVLEDNGYIQIYKKEEVTRPAIIQKTFGNGDSMWPAYNEYSDEILFYKIEAGNSDVFTINESSKGTAIKAITNTDDEEFNASWSPDGKSIVFEKGSHPRQYVRTYKSGLSTTSLISANQIWIKYLETGELKMIGNGSYPKFSPDGKYIAFVKFELGTSNVNQSGTLWIMNIDGDNRTQVTTNSLGNLSRPNWSPDGKSIIFQLTKRDKYDSDIYSISISGENLIQYTNNNSNDFSPYWSKDGFIYFSSDRGSLRGKYQIWRFKI